MSPPPIGSCRAAPRVLTRWRLQVFTVAQAAVHNYLSARDTSARPPQPLRSGGRGGRGAGWARGGSPCPCKEESSEIARACKLDAWMVARNRSASGDGAAVLDTAAGSYVRQLVQQDLQAQRKEYLFRPPALVEEWLCRDLAFDADRVSVYLLWDLTVRPFPPHMNATRFQLVRKSPSTRQASVNSCGRLSHVLGAGDSVAFSDRSLLPPTVSLGGVSEAPCNASLVSAALHSLPSLHAASQLVQVQTEESACEHLH